MRRGGRILGVGWTLFPIWGWTGSWSAVAASEWSGSWSSPVSSSTTDNLERLGLWGIKPDPFVMAAPLIVAADCSDGIAMVAAHTVSLEERLLRPLGPDQAEGRPWRDLPTDHGGPHRIRRIDGTGSHLLSAGWRADCDLLTEKLRSLASREVAVFGSPQRGVAYGRLLAQQAAVWMAHLAISEKYRPLSCVGLLAVCASQQQSSTTGDFNGSLWFFDCTGAHRARALALGGGKADLDRQEEGDRYVAQLVNAQLMETDFTKMTAEQGAAHILNILAGKTSNDPLLPAGCEMEVACISHPNGFRRLSASTLTMINEDAREGKPIDQ